MFAIKLRYDVVKVQINDVQFWKALDLDFFGQYSTYSQVVDKKRYTKFSTFFFLKKKKIKIKYATEIYYHLITTRVKHKSKTDM